MLDEDKGNVLLLRMSNARYLALGMSKICKCGMASLRVACQDLLNILGTDILGSKVDVKKIFLAGLV